MNEQPQPANNAAPGTDTDHFENGVRCGFCGRAWPCPGYQSDYQASMRARNAVQDQQWAQPTVTPVAPVPRQRRP